MSFFRDKSLEGDACGTCQQVEGRALRCADSFLRWCAEREKSLTESRHAGCEFWFEINSCWRRGGRKSKRENAAASLNAKQSLNDVLDRAAWRPKQQPFFGGVVMKPKRKLHIVPIALATFGRAQLEEMRATGKVLLLFSGRIGAAHRWVLLLDRDEGR